MQPWFYMLCAQKNRLIETALFSTHNICFGGKYLRCIFPFLKLFLSIVTILINSRERQHNYRTKLPIFLDNHDWPNSSDPHQTVPREEV